MNNQGGMPENVVAFRRPEIGQVKSVPPSGGSITNFRHLRQPESIVSPTATTGTPPSNIVEGLFPEPSNTPGEGLSRKDILDIALHKKAA